jgi:hypothetical protein
VREQKRRERSISGFTRKGVSVFRALVAPRAGLIHNATIRQKLIKLSITSCRQVAIFSVKPVDWLYDEYLGPCDQGAIGRKDLWRNGSAAESPISRFQAGERGIAKPSRENIFELTRIFGVPLEQVLTEADRQA